MRIKVICRLLIFALTTCFWLGTGNVVNAKTDGWIGTSEGADTGSGGGGGGGGHATKSYSWIYYQSQINEPLNMDFAPINTGTDGITIVGGKSIDGACSNGVNRGFWHLGTNAVSSDKSNSARYTGYYSFDSGANIYALGFPKISSILSYNPPRATLNWPKYGYASTRSGDYGHSDTRNVKTFWGWDIARPGNERYGWYEQWVPSNVNHGLYHNGNLVYKAVKSGSSSSVLNDFKKAYRAINGTDYTGSNLPDGVFAFCYWDDIEKEYTLTAKAVDITGQSLGGVIQDVTRKATEGNVASVERKTNDDYMFYCWKNTATGDCITSTNSSDSLFISGTGGIKINKKMTENYTVYAVYVKAYKLIISKDDYSTVKVTRTASPYAKAPTGTLSNNAKIYYGDKLSVELNGSDCHPSYLGKYTIDSVQKNAGTHSVAVANNVVVTASTGIESYTLRIDQATGSKITVNRKTVANGAPSSVKRGTLSNGATIYCGDTLTASFGLDTGYEWGEHEFKGKNIDDKTRLIIDNPPHVVGADVTVSTITGRKNVALNAYAIKVNSSGGYLADLNNGNSIDSMSVDYGAEASVNHNKFMPTGYTFRGWRENKTSGSLLNKDVYAVKNLTVENKNVYAGYERNAFEGRARVFAGDSTEGGSFKDTGFVSFDKTEPPLEVPCSSNGCNVTFDFALRTVAGTGKTSYAIQRKKNTDDYGGVLSTTSPVSPFAPGATGSIIQIGDKDSVTVKLRPGDEYCYRLQFMPYGVQNNDTRKDLVVCASAIPTTFEGKTDVSGAYTTTTGWRKTTKEIYHTVSGCSLTDGCKVRFTHSLKSIPANGDKTIYYVNRDSNLHETSRGIPAKRVVDFTEFNGEETVVSSGEDLTIYPGMYVCEALRFLPDNTTVPPESEEELKEMMTTTKICIAATGNAQPDGNENLLDIKINKTGENGTYSDETQWMKPGDTAYFQTTYNPVLQYTYYLRPQKVAINGGALYLNDDGEKNLVCRLGIPATGCILGGLPNRSLFNYYNRLQNNAYNKNNGSTVAEQESNTKYLEWNNAFTVQLSSNNFSSYSKVADYDSYANGDSSEKKENNSQKITSSDVGKTISERALINFSDNNTIKTTPNQVSFEAFNAARVITSEVADTVSAKVPYNFNTRIMINTSGESAVYAGEKASSVSYDVEVVKKNNSLTTDGKDSSAYTTIIKNARIKAIAYADAGEYGGVANYGDINSSLCSYYGGVQNCQEVNISTNYTFNSAGSLDGYTEKGPQISGLYVPDVDAGSNYCVAVAIYPSSSGSDDNLNTSGSGTWRISDSKCFKVAKKPNFQLWGGGILMNGGAKLYTSEKKNLDGFAVASSGSPTYVFGSFVETNLIANGIVTGLASGAGTGYTSTGLTANPGGSMENSVSYCQRSMLSIANNNCSNSVGNAGLSVLTNNISEKTAIVNKLFPGMEANITNGTINLETDYNETSAGVRYSYSNNNLTINAATVGKGVTHVVRSDKNVLIAGNLIYEDSYSKLEQIPKLVILAKNIKVNCDVASVVSRIDAVLIAEENVDTCSVTDGDKGAVTGIDSEANSKQLKINGMILANSLTLNRTYGAARGVRSIVPAEIINYDTSLYLWSFGGKSDPENTGKFTQTYLRELPPRY